jgi:hypothetical protein
MTRYFLSKVTGKDLKENTLGLILGTVPVFLCVSGWVGECGAELKNENHQHNRSVVRVLHPVPSENKAVVMFVCPLCSANAM